jgi:ribosomal protein S18 acetylase RimI-like enzyme
MRKANYSDKTLVVDILARSFADNKSVNYIVKQDNRRKGRLKKLMAYSFEICYRYGKVFLTDDKKACALILLPDKKPATLYSMYLDMMLIFQVIGLKNIRKVVTRESKIKQHQLKEHAYYLWFIGVDPDAQHKGIGSSLLDDLIKEAKSVQRTIYLETSTLKNIPWYEKFGFSIYNRLNLGYEIFFLKN